MLIYLSGGFKPKAKNYLNSGTDSSSELLAGGETVFYSSRNVVVAEVKFLVSLLFVVSFFLQKEFAHSFGLVVL